MCIKSFCMYVYICTYLINGFFVMVAFIYTFVCSLEIAGYTGHKVDELFHFHMLHMHQCSLWQCPKYLKNKSV